METKTEIPKWMEKVMGMWERHYRKKWPAELREAWRELHRKRVAELRKVDLMKQSDVGRAWHAWLLEVCEELAEHGIDEMGNEDEDQSEWEENVETEVCDAYMPTINLKALLKKRRMQPLPMLCGELIGHEYMIWSQHDVGLKSALAGTPEDYRNAMLLLFEHVRGKRLQLVKKALAIANDQSRTEVKQFFRGYYLALDKGTLTEQGEPVGKNYATRIHLAMCVYSDFVGQLKNNRELLEWLKMVLGNSESWNENSQKRIEKIAQRLKLHLDRERRKSDKSRQTPSE